MDQTDLNANLSIIQHHIYMTILNVPVVDSASKKIVSTISGTRFPSISTVDELIVVICEFRSASVN